MLSDVKAVDGLRASVFTELARPINVLVENDDILSFYKFLNYPNIIIRSPDQGNVLKKLCSRRGIISIAIMGKFDIMKTLLPRSMACVHGISAIAVMEKFEYRRRCHTSPLLSRPACTESEFLLSCGRRCGYIRIPPPTNPGPTSKHDMGEFVGYVTLQHGTGRIQSQRPASNCSRSAVLQPSVNRTGFRSDL